MREGPVLIVLVGVPASGKSTWAHRNAQNAIVVSQDDLIDAITPSGFDYSARPIYSAAEDAVAKTALVMGRSVIVDHTNRTRALRRRWLAIGQEADCPAIAVIMSCDFDTCRRRNRERSDSRRVSEERMERMISAFEEPTLREGFAAVIDRCACQTVSDACRLANASGS